MVKPSCRDDTWEIPGGGLGAGEDPPQAARREVREELGIEEGSTVYLQHGFDPARPEN
ncbi:NUDIX domain-containing protein [Streptomyces sp. NPDC048411]|uniref:NUDIX domain-containing protein n=1 Tax=Streptomyces sp. NPDC048411 TaxID=3157206 RepID=UPI003451EFF0